MGRFHNINGEIVPFTEAEEAQRDAEELQDAQRIAKAKAQAYKFKRLLAYPTLQECIEALMEDKAGDSTKLTALLQARQEIKDLYPSKG